MRKLHKTQRDVQLLEIEKRIVDYGRIVKSRSWGGCHITQFAEAEHEYNKWVQRRKELLATDVEI